MITYGSTTLTSYNTITKIEVYYYKSTSATDLAGGSWSTTKPSWENGKYIWQKIRTTYEGKLENGQFYSESDPVNITGQQGATGTSAYSYKLNASDSVIGKTKNGEYTISKITFIATYKQGTGAVTAYTGRFKIETTANGTTWTTQYTSSGNESSKEYTIPEDIISIRCSLYQSGGTSTLLDITTIPVVKDGIDAVGLRDSIPYYLASDKQTGVTRLDQGWTRFKPELTTEKRYLWVYYVSRYSEGNTQPELIEIKNDIVSFENHGDESPVENCVIDIEPMQDLNGYDSPWPAGGGKNLFDEENATIYARYFKVQGDTSVWAQTSDSASVVFPCTEGTTYTVSAYNNELTIFRVGTIEQLPSASTDAPLISNVTKMTQSGSITITPGSGATYIVIQCSAAIMNNRACKIQIELGSTATDYAPYSNICPISGWTGAKVARTGKNLIAVDMLDLPTTGKDIKDSNGNIITSGNSRYTHGYIPVKPNTRYVVKGTLTNSTSTWAHYEYDANKNWIRRVSHETFINGRLVVTTTSETYWLQIQYMYASANFDTLQFVEEALEEDVTATNAVYSITFPSEAGTVYGGELDVTNGVLTVDRAMVDLGTLTYTKISESVGDYFRSLWNLTGGNELNIISDRYVVVIGSQVSRNNCQIGINASGLYVYIRDDAYTDADSFKTAMNGSLVIYPLATPVTYHLTPQEITMLTGQNHIFSDTGQTAISYYDNQTSSDPYVDYSATSAFEVAQIALNQSIEYIVGTQTATTGSWTGVTRDNTLLTGKNIAYKLPYSGSGNASLNLTLSDGTTTGAIAVYLNTTRATTHFGAGSVINMTYDGQYWRITSIPNSNTIENVIPYFTGKTGAVGIWRYSLFMRDENGTYQNICTASDGTVTTSNSTVETTKKANSHGFEVGSPIWYANSAGYNANANITGNNAIYSSTSAIDSRYSLNTERKANSLTPYLPVYLVGEVRNDNLFHLDTVWWTQTPTDSSKVYVLIGGCYDSTTSNVRITLYEQNNWFKYVNGKLVDYTNRLAELAASTATAYITDTTGNGIMVHPENDTTSGWSIAGAIELFKTGISYIKLWIDNNIPKIRIGKEDSKHVLIDDDSVDIVDDETVLASFGEVVVVGQDANDRMIISPTEIYCMTKNNQDIFRITHYSGEVETGTDFQITNETSQYIPKDSLNRFAYTLSYVPKNGTMVTWREYFYDSNYNELNSQYGSRVYNYTPSSNTPNTEENDETIIDIDDDGWAEAVSEPAAGFEDRPQETIVITEECFYPHDGLTIGVGTSTSAVAYVKFIVSYTSQTVNQTEQIYYTFGKRKNDYEAGKRSFVIGYDNTAIGNDSFAEGYDNVASGDNSHAEGSSTEASGYDSHTEGLDTIASGNYAHAEGYGTLAYGSASHSEGRGTEAHDSYAHAEGWDSSANGLASHAEGCDTEAYGSYSHAQNRGTIASSFAQTALGRWNIEDEDDTYAIIIGNGSDDDNRSNTLAVTWDGDTEFALDTTASSGTTDADLYDAITALGWNINDITV